MLKLNLAHLFLFCLIYVFICFFSHFFPCSYSRYLIIIVVRQKYQVGVKDAHVLAGNTGVLKCDIPTHAKEYVAVTSWVQDSAFNIYPAPESGGYIFSQ